MKGLNKSLTSCKLIKEIKKVTFNTNLWMWVNEIFCNSLFPQFMKVWVVLQFPMGGFKGWTFHKLPWSTTLCLLYWSSNVWRNIYQLRTVYQPTNRPPKDVNYTTTFYGENGLWCNVLQNCVYDWVKFE